MDEAVTPSRVRTADEVYGYGSAFADDGPSCRARPGTVVELGLAPGSTVLDVGAREGHYCVELSRHFGFRMHGVEPVRRHLDNAARALQALAATEPEVAARIRMDEGVAERLAEPDASVDLIWCRDVLVHVADLKSAFGEFRRVLRPGGHAVIYQMTATDWLTPAEAARMWPSAGVHASSTEPRHFEAAIAAGGLAIAQRIELHGEWREWSEEEGDHRTSRQLLHVSRLLRNRPVFEERFGTDAYEAMLTDNLWGVYQMIGKLNPHVYVLSR